MREIVHFGDYRLLPRQRELWFGDRRVAIGGRALDVLTVLVQAEGELVTKAELAQRAWGVAAVEDNTLSAQVAAVRKALGCGLGGRRYVETAPGRGYRFVARLDDGPTPRATVQAAPAIAVAGFADLGGAPPALRSGLAEAVVAALSRYRHLTVLEGDADAPGLARYTVGGGVHTIGDRVRVTARLRDTVSPRQIWTQSFSAATADALALEDEVALAVAGVAPPAVETAEQVRLEAEPAERLAPHQLYLRARSRSLLMTRPALLEALALLERALTLRPDFALALADAGLCHSQLIAQGLTGGDDTTHRAAARARARRALDLADDDPEVLEFAAATLFFLGDEPEAVGALLERALALNPALVVGLMMRGFLARRSGDFALAEERLEAATRLGPLSPFRALMLSELGKARIGRRRFAEALSSLQEAVQLNPNQADNHAWLAVCYRAIGNSADAGRHIAAFQAAAHYAFDAWLREPGYSRRAVLAAAAG